MRRKTKTFKPYPPESWTAPVKERKAPSTETADAIKKLVAAYYKKKMRAVYTEMGLVKGGRLRADVLALAMNGYVVIVEVKSSVADFRSDRKASQYLSYCNQGYIALTSAVYEKVSTEIDPSFGVFIITNDLTKIRKVMKAKRRELDTSVSTSLAIRCAFRNQDRTDRKNKRA